MDSAVRCVVLLGSYNWLATSGPKCVVALLPHHKYVHTHIINDKITPQSRSPSPACIARAARQRSTSAATQLAGAGSSRSSAAASAVARARIAPRRRSMTSPVRSSSAVSGARPLAARPSATARARLTAPACPDSAASRSQYTRQLVTS